MFTVQRVSTKGRVVLVQDDEYEVHYEWNDVEMMKGNITYILAKISTGLASPEFMPEVVLMKEVLADEMVVDIPDLNTDVNMV